MKRIFYLLLVFMSLFLFSCDKKDEISYDSLKNVFDSLNSYSLECDMTIYKNDKELKHNVSVDYLSPSYYKVCFKQDNSHNQYIVKNLNGVYIVTPSLNKEFKFESNWPDSKIQGYLINNIWKSICYDNNIEHEIKENSIVIKANITDDVIKHLEFCYDLKKNMPIYSILYDKDNKKLISIEFKSFELNPKLKEEEFNTKYILDSYTSIEYNDTYDLTISVSTTDILKSRKSNDTYEVLCYGGEKNYTIISKKIEVSSYNYNYEVFTDYSFIECGLLLYCNRVSKYFVNDYEVSIYSADMSIDEVCQIVENITIS